MYKYIARRVTRLGWKILPVTHTMASQIPQISWYAGKIKFIGQSADGEHMTAAESDFFIPMGAEQIEFNLNPLA